MYHAAPAPPATNSTPRMMPMIMPVLSSSSAAFLSLGGAAVGLTLGVIVLTTTTSYVVGGTKLSSSTSTSESAVEPEVWRAVSKSPVVMWVSVSSVTAEKRAVASAYVVSSRITLVSYSISTPELSSARISELSRRRRDTSVIEVMVIESAVRSSDAAAIDSLKDSCSSSPKSAAETPDTLNVVAQVTTVWVVSGVGCGVGSLLPPSVPLG
mmetsp:Transcript_17143/g.35833  ORF Transcript_17143/g.35833 Transcript_17143/m.35833 type:complete len:211 (+) Transcript_17143:266-898(+)